MRLYTLKIFDIGPREIQFIQPFVTFLRGCVEMCEDVTG